MKSLTKSVLQYIGLVAAIGTGYTVEKNHTALNDGQPRVFNKGHSLTGEFGRGNAPLNSITASNSLELLATFSFKRKGGIRIKGINNFDMRQMFMDY